jgi:hypothetical protein
LDHNSHRKRQTSHRKYFILNGLLIIKTFQDCYHISVNKISCIALLLYWGLYKLILCDNIKTLPSTYILTTLLVLHIHFIYRTHTSETNKIRHTVQFFFGIFIYTTFPCSFLLLVLKKTCKIFSYNVSTCTDIFPCAAHSHNWHFALIKTHLLSRTGRQQVGPQAVVKPVAGTISIENIFLFLGLSNWFNSKIAYIWLTYTLWSSKVTKVCVWIKWQADPIPFGYIKVLKSWLVQNIDQINLW